MLLTSPSANDALQALPDLLYNAAYEVHQQEAPVACLITDAISACSTAVQLSHDVRGLDKRTMPTSLNTVAAVPSGVGKGTSYRAFFGAFTNHLKEQARRSAGGAGGCAVVDDVIFQVISFPALMDHLAGFNRNGSIQWEDGRGFLKSPLVKGHLDKCTQAWSGDPPLRYKNKLVDLTAIDARLNIGIRIQLELLLDFLRREAYESVVMGFWPRFIAALHDPKRFEPSFMSVRSPTSGMDELTLRLQELLTEAEERAHPNQTERSVVALGEEASAFMHQLKFYLKQWTNIEFADVAEAARRAWENTLRLAAVFHVVCRCEGDISRDMVERAWTIVEWSLSQHRLIFSRADEEQLPPRMAEAACSSRRPRKHSPYQDAQTMLACLEALVSQSRDGHTELARLHTRSGLPAKRGKTALLWLAQNHVVETCRSGQRTLVRLAPGSDLQLFGPGTYRSSGGAL